MNTPAPLLPRFGAALLLASAALLWCTPAPAQWVWRDKDGVQASDRPPPASVPDKDILQKPNSARRAALASAPPPASAASPAVSAASAASAASGNKLEAEVEARRKKAEQEEAAKRKATEEANAKIRAENCTNARRQVATLESGTRISRMNDKGEREILDDKGRAAEMERARSIVASDCQQ